MIGGQVAHGRGTAMSELAGLTVRRVTTALKQAMSLQEGYTLAGAPRRPVLQTSTSMMHSRASSRHRE